MSIKIDLLPGYLNLQRWFRNWIWISLAALLLTAGVLYILWYGGEETLKVARQDYENLAAAEQATQTAESKRDAAQSAAQPIETVVDFIVNAGKTGPERAALIDLARRYIYAGAVVSAIDMSDGQNANFNYTVRDEQEYAQSLLALRNGSVDNGGVLFKENPTQITATGVPGGPNPAFIAPPPLPGEPARVIPYPLQIGATGPLKDPVVIPPEPGTAAAAPAAGAAGAGAGGAEGAAGGGTAGAAGADQR